MGMDADAELIWGVPVLAYDEDTGEPTPFWNEAEDDWHDFGELIVSTYGHCEDPDGPRGILTYIGVTPLRGDCWTPKSVGDLSVSDTVYSKASEVARAHKLPVIFQYAGWWLVASYG